MPAKGRHFSVNNLVKNQIVPDGRCSRTERKTWRVNLRYNFRKLVSGERRKINESDIGLTVGPPSKMTGVRGFGVTKDSNFDQRPMNPYTINSRRAQVSEWHLGFEFSDSTINWQSGLTSDRRPLRNHLTILFLHLLHFSRTLFPHEKIN